MAAAFDPLRDPVSCPVAPAALVRICEIVKELSFPAWLCPAGMRQRQKEGFTIRDRRAPPHDGLTCDAHRLSGTCAP